MKRQNTYIIGVLLVISNIVVAQNFHELEDSLINVTINDYSKNKLLMWHNAYTIADVSNYEPSNYWVVSYLPERNNKLTISPSKSDSNKFDFTYNKVKMFGRHPVFWSKLKDSTSYDKVLEVMSNHNLIDSTFLEFDYGTINNFDNLPLTEMNDRALVVYYIFRKGDMKLIKRIKTRYYERVYEYVNN